MTVNDMMRAAKAASPVLAGADTSVKNAALEAMADRLLYRTGEILAANETDLAAARGIISDVMLDRLSLDEKRIAAMADGIRSVAALRDPVGRVIDRTERPNGLIIEKTSVPLGVVAIIYESRPNVTSDAAALCIKSGNACILRGGKEALNSSLAVSSALREGISSAGLPEELIQFVTDTSRQSAADLMRGVGFIDLLIPRGGRGLINACIENARVPCIRTGEGICHIYVDRAADIDMAVIIVENAKTSRPSVCNAEEVLLVHRDIAPVFLPVLRKALCDDRAAAGKTPVEFRADPESLPYSGGVPAGAEDFDTEFLDYILAVRTVASVGEAVDHISAHSTGHSEAIITSDSAAAEEFLRGVDSAAVYVNASTRFTDGGEFGLGCEMGISTQKLHARGPMGLCELTSYKYVVRGNGQIRG